MKRKFLDTAIYTAILLVVSFMVSTVATAQSSYGDGTYNDGVYSDSSGDTNNPEETPSPGGGTTDNDTPSQSGDTPVDEKNSQPDTPDDGPEDTVDNDDTANPRSSPAETEEGNSSSNTLWQRIGIGSLIAASLLVAITLIARKRRQE